MYINSITNGGGNLISKSRKIITEIVVYKQGNVYIKNIHSSTTKKSGTNKSHNKHELLRTRYLSSKDSCDYIFSLIIIDYWLV